MDGLTNKGLMLLVVVATGFLASAAIGQQGPSEMRLEFVRANGIPEIYQDAEAPAANDETVATGAALYAEHCLTCHGETGVGDGEAGGYYDPLPSNLVEALKLPEVTDDYLLWSIAEGGKPVKSGMSSYKKKLDNDQIWALVHYLRTEFGE